MQVLTQLRSNTEYSAFHHLKTFIPKVLEELWWGEGGKL